MTLALTDDQRMIRDAAASFLADASDAAAVRAALESESGLDDKLWKGITELGWCGTAIDEAFGGMGLGPLELVLILEQMGRHLACVPFRSTVALAGSLLTQAGNAAVKKKYLPLIASGSLRATVAFDAAGVKAKKGRNGSWILNGRIEALVDGACAQLVLVQLGEGVFAVDASAK